MHNDPEPAPPQYPPLPEGHWFHVIEKITEARGGVPSPMSVRARILVDALGIPCGEFSALTTTQEGEEHDSKSQRENDRVIAELLTNMPGVWVDKKRQIFSTDPRDIYPNGLPKILRDALSPAACAILDIEYEHRRAIRDRFVEDTQDEYQADCPIHYTRLLGGIDIFLRGSLHDSKWQKNHGRYLAQANRHAAIICIEGFPEEPIGKSLPLMWSDKNRQDGDFDVLMHEAVENGFVGFFTEVDARDESKISLDGIGLLYTIDSDPHDLFFQHYFAYLQKEHPGIANSITTSVQLREVFHALSFRRHPKKGIKNRRTEKQFDKNTGYINFPFLTEDGKTTTMPTRFMFGQYLFSDALAAVKLHLLGKLMGDGHVPSGPIIDYEGVGHLSNKQFFLRHPEHALEVVLLNVHELMASRVKKKGDIEEIYQIFQSPDWSAVLEEITKLPLIQVENAPDKPVAIGPNQRQLIDVPIDYCEIYGIDPKTLMPSDEEIKQIIEKATKNR